MSKVVDPYYEWLGIPPKDQPPNHYRLLGLELFEENRNVIDAAANRQMGFIKDYQAGPSSDLTQKILNELSAARVCLLAPKRKAEYDRQLREKLEPLGASTTTETETLEDLATVETAAPVMLPPLALPPALPSKPWQPSSMAIAAFIAIGCILTGVVVGFMLLQLLREDDPSSEPVAQQTTVHDDVTTATAAEASGTDSEPDDDEAIESLPETGTGDSVPPFAPETSGSMVESAATLDVETQSRPSVVTDSNDAAMLADVLMPGEAGNAPMSEVSLEAISLPETSSLVEMDAPTTPVSREPVPSADLQQRIIQEIGSFYEIDTESEFKTRELYEELLALGRDVREKPERRFVLLRLVAQMAVRVGDCETMFDAVEEIEDSFDVQGSDAKAKLLLQMLSSTDDSAMVMTFLRNYEPVLVELLNDDQYELAGQLSSAAVSFCDRPIGSKEFRQAILDRHASLDTMSRAYTAAQEAVATVQRNSNDAEANSIVGRWRCFVKDDWSRGLHHLASGSDQRLRAIANHELQDLPRDTDEMLSLADQWWELAEEASELERRGMLLRAGHWYGLIDANSISGMDRIKIQSRVAEIDRIGGEVLSEDPGSLARSEGENQGEETSATTADLTLLFNRGLSAAMQEHDWEQAERFFDRCIDIDSGHVPSLNNHALASLRCANTRGAIRSFEAAVELQPTAKPVAHNMALLSRLVDKDRANLDGSTRQKLDSLLVAAGADSTYRLERGFVYMPSGGDQSDSSALVDCTCLACNGVGHADCPVRGCTRGSVTSSRSDVVGRNTVTGQAILKTRATRVPCQKCRGRGTVDCPYCSNGTMASLD